MYVPLAPAAQMLGAAPPSAWNRKQELAGIANRSGITVALTSARNSTGKHQPHITCSITRLSEFQGIQCSYVRMCHESNLDVSHESNLDVQS
jgi:hypothetical protein